MKQIFHKIMSILMAFVVLCSTMSFTINTHYCGDKLVDSAIFSKAETCGMEMELATSTNECSVSKKNCCSDEFEKIEGQNELQSSIDTISFEQQVFITSFIYTYVNLFESIDSEVSLYDEDQSPLVCRKIYKLDETYLI
ncbi:HYC_CC_PP family protein [Lutibacter oricola]|nr:hypothetical protein [Lutibacter oricola]